MQYIDPRVDKSPLFYFIRILTLDDFNPSFFSVDEHMQKSNFMRIIFDTYQ